VADGNMSHSAVPRPSALKVVQSVGVALSTWRPLASRHNAIARRVRTPVTQDGWYLDLRAVCTRGWVAPVCSARGLLLAATDRPEIAKNAEPYGIDDWQPEHEMPVCLL
jgi:hypothetical protein